ncbi:hypothetical protein Q7P37_008635 [Cladosporium fusiforme]
MIATDILALIVNFPVATCLSISFTLILTTALQAAYRIWLHPLSRFPGPRQAAISNAWLYKLSRTGRQEEEFEKLHHAYGTNALRIGPNELHISDVSLYHRIYSQRTQYHKQENLYEGFGTPDALFAQVDVALHKKRRQQLSPFFARAGILRLEPTIREHTFKLRAKITILIRQGKPIFANNAFRCVAGDIVSHFAFAKSREMVDSSDERFVADWLEALDGAAKILWDSIYSPFTRRIGNFLPKAITSRLSKSLGRIFALADQAAESVRAHKASPSQHDSPVIFDSLPDLSEKQLIEEAVDLLVAGSDTTALTLTFGVWHISSDPFVKSNLVAALENGLSNTGAEFPTLIQLESIPYLVACVKESLRIAMPVPGRLPRVIPAKPSDPLVVDGMMVPPGTTVGMSAYTMHSSEQLWGKDARAFNPDRWIGEAGKGLDANLVSFSKGARSCVAQNLAFAELLTIIAMLFRDFTVEIDPKTGNGIVARDDFTKSITEPGLLLKMALR